MDVEREANGSECTPFPERKRRAESELQAEDSTVLQSTASERRRNDSMVIDENAMVAERPKARGKKKDNRSLASMGPGAAGGRNHGAVEAIESKVRPSGENDAPRTWTGTGRTGKNKRKGPASTKEPQAGRGTTKGSSLPDVGSARENQRQKSIDNKSSQVPATHRTTSSTEGKKARKKKRRGSSPTGLV
ncbi:hypothetical protein CKM354_000560700 [Cercospora kikuchii]|uniref:Uncharacterized protein n=1 Tax=Cercospora kikuchii TaxID=84275 RepID=A0A9P3FFQ3_9PEZI|nr:uncharacterized protein CKM354_000560700 [Cercospora kikuchii]GIZ42332.1 hypothetical protein CKM354_000560700 [Cercospora kikuchii]